ncbi:hypothetical protein B9Z55_014412 [Caenorhabditis nigoni]|uniref:Uncharacterized protein n=1 Tax=Caenorhabditis nigoni TaxID=1611254 RepID=A0A2G5U5S5_9PELO|nr:hypothetical protein B9Z55_014412 [Caenorhabditis nigoni]
MTEAAEWNERSCLVSKCKSSRTTSRALGRSGRTVGRTSGQLAGWTGVQFSWQEKLNKKRSCLVFGMCQLPGLRGKITRQFPRSQVYNPEERWCTGIVKKISNDSVQDVSGGDSGRAVGRAV